MQKEPKELFSTILRPAQQILDKIGPERKVYLADKIYKAFESTIRYPTYWTITIGGV